MSHFSKFLIVLLALSLTGCYIRPRNMPVAPMPLATLTPGQSTMTPPWVQTATLPDPNTSPQPGSATNTPTQEGGLTQAPTSQSSDVKAVLVKDDVRLRTGPGSEYDVLGLAHAGMVLVVTGKSSDGEWWQVTCDLGPKNVCWVSADPELTEPTTP